MPNIVQYEAPQGLALHPTETGITAVAAAARRVQGEYNEVAAAKKETGQMVAGAIKDAGDAAVKYVEHQEVSHGALGLAALTSLRTKQWQNTIKNADPNDPTIVPQFMEGLEDDINQWKGSFHTENGQKWAESRAEALRTHMYHTTSADQAAMASAAVVKNMGESLNLLINTTRDSPDGLKNAMSTWDASFDAVRGSANITPEQHARLEQVKEHGFNKIGMSALLGSVEKNPGAFDTPEKARAQVERMGLTKYVSDTNSLVSQAKTVTRNARVDETYRRHLDDLAKTEADHAAQGEWLQAITSDDPQLKGQVSAKSIARDGRLKPSTVENLIRFQEHEAGQKEVTKDNPDVAASLRSGILDPDNPTTASQVITESIRGNLSKQTRDDILHLVDRVKNEKLHDPMFTAALHSAEATLVQGDMPGFGGALLKDSKGKANYSDFLGVFTPQYLALPPDQRAAAINFKDPGSLINKTMEPFKRSFSERLAERTATFNQGGVTVTPEGNKPLTPPRPAGQKEPPRPDGLPEGAQYDFKWNKWFRINNGVKQFWNP